MNGLSWLNDLMVWLARWIPRATLIKAGEVALWFGPRGRTKALIPGWYVYWPITSDILVMSTKRRTIEMCGQVHGREVVALVIQWRVVSALAALAWNNIPANIDDRSAAHLTQAYDPDRSSDDLATIVRDRLRSEFASDGIAIEAVDVAQRGPIRTFRMMNDWATHEATTL